MVNVANTSNDLFPVISFVSLIVDATILGVAKLMFSFAETSTAAEPETKSNGGSDSMSPTDRKAWLRQTVSGLNNVESVKKSGFGNAKSEETKKRIRQASETGQMGLFDWALVLDNE